MSSHAAAKTHLPSDFIAKNVDGAWSAVSTKADAFAEVFVKLRPLVDGRIKLRVPIH